MIEIHSHILPNIDDGPKSMSESLKMAQAAVKQGIHTTIATPHHLNGSVENKKLDIVEAVIHFSHELQQANIPLTVLPGQEIRLSWDLVERLNRNELLPLNEHTKYILIEFPSNHVPKFAEQVLFDLQMKGYTPVLAHPERNMEITKKPQLLYELVKKGMLVQVTSGSITGRFSKKLSKFTNEMIKSNLVHFISSDAHNLNNRPFELKEAYKKIDKTFGMHMHYYFLENAQSMIENEPIFAEPPNRIRSKKIFGLI